MYETDGKKLFVVGAPKCGTTSMHNWLSKQKDVFMSPVKEPEFFSKDINKGKIDTKKQYKSLFDGAKGHKFIGESSTMYMYSQCAVDLIEECFDSPLYIIMLRCPVKMIVSYHQQRIFSLQEDIGNFKKAWEMSEIRRKGKNVPYLCADPELSDYKRMAKVGNQLRELLTKVDKDRVKVIFLEDVDKREMETLKKVKEFLGLGNSITKGIKKENKSKKEIRHRRVEKARRIIANKWGRIKKLLGIPPQFSLNVLSKVRNMNVGKGKKYEVDEETKKMLKKNLQQDANIVRKLTERKLEHWIV